MVQRSQSPSTFCRRGAGGFSLFLGTLGRLVVWGGDWAFSEWALLTVSMQIVILSDICLFRARQHTCHLGPRSLIPYSHPQAWLVLSLFPVESLQLLTERPALFPNFSKCQIPNWNPSLSESKAAPLPVPPQPSGVFFSVDFWVGRNYWGPSYSEI